MFRSLRAAVPAILAATLATGGCGTSHDAPAAEGASQGAAAPVGPLQAGETEIAGVALRLPADHRLRQTAQGPDYRLYAVTRTADSTANLLEFYLGDLPQFDASSARTVAVNGLTAHDRVARRGENLWSREVLVELPRTEAAGAPGAQPTRLHVWYNKLASPQAGKADSVIASIRCCVQPTAASAAAPSGT